MRDERSITTLHYTTLRVIAAVPGIVIDGWIFNRVNQIIESNTGMSRENGEMGWDGMR